MPEDRATTFLQMIRRSQRGRLKIYLGYGPGVGKTYQMLTEAHRLKQDGIDVVVGLVETHGRADTAKLIDGLELIPRRKLEYHGIVVEEMDVDAVIARHPQVVLVDELAHTNVPGGRNDKRYQDVQEILAAGIHVISTLNVQHLESLYNTVEKLINVKVRERLPDSVLADADQVVNIDLTAEDLQQRLKEGKIYPRDRIATSLENFFTTSNLEHLRELTLRELASQLDFKRREVRNDDEGRVPDQIMVALSSRGPNSAKLLRFGSRLAGRLNRNWYAVYVQTPSEEPTVIDAATQRLLADTLTLANQLGAMVFTFKGQDVCDTLLRFAKEYRVGQIVIGGPRPISWWKRLLGKRSVAEELVCRARGVSVIVVDASTPDETSVIEPRPPLAPKTVSPAPSAVSADSAPVMAGSLTVDRIRVFDDPLSKEDVLRRLIAAIAQGGAPIDPARAVSQVLERERQGSTFLNEGVALPHARLDGLDKPQVALAITHAGILDADTVTPIEAVFLLLSPASGAAGHLQLLAKGGRLLQNREVRRGLTKASSPAGVMHIIRAWEESQPPKAS